MILSHWSFWDWEAFERLVAWGVRLNEQLSILKIFRFLDLDSVMQNPLPLIVKPSLAFTENVVYLQFSDANFRIDLTIWPGQRMSKPAQYSLFLFSSKFERQGGGEGTTRLGGMGMGEDNKQVCTLASVAGGVTTSPILLPFSPKKSPLLVYCSGVYLLNLPGR